jgi:hypothetical protein
MGLFISLKYFNVFIYLLLSSIRSNYRDSYPFEKLRKCYHMRVYIISEGGNTPKFVCVHMLCTQVRWGVVGSNV